MKWLGIFKFIFCCLSALIGGRNISQKFSMRRENLKLNDLVVKDWPLFTAPTLQACMAICSQNVSCKTISYNAERKLCDLTRHLIWHDNGFDWAGQPEAGWTMMAKDILSVVNKQLPYGPYEITFEMASSVCTQIQGTVASREDVLQAVADGCHSCQCGWMSDGSQGYALQHHWALCSDPDDEFPGIIPCNMARSNVWCQLP